MSEPAGAGRAALLWRAPLAALTLLTILPVPARAQRGLGAREVAASAGLFPLVGAVLGLLAGGIGHAVAVHATPTLGAATAIVLVALLTGALHLDGLADATDALGARGRSRERRLEIMRDPITGAYGTAAIGSWLLLGAAALAAVPPSFWAIVLAWVLGLARALAVAHARALPPARGDGLGAGFTVTLRGLIAAAVVAVLLGTALAALPVDVGWRSSPDAGVFDIAALGALIAYVAVLVLAWRLLGGRTGDTLGASIAACELAGLLGAAVASG